MSVSRTTVRRLAALALGLGVVVGTFAFVLPRIADYRDVWEVVRTLTDGNLAGLVGATVVNVLTFAPSWMAALPGLGFRQALMVTQASTASTYIAPGGAAPGLAVSYAMLRAWGFSGSSVTIAVALTGAFNQLFIFGCPPVALALLTLVGQENPALQTFAVIGVAVFAGIVAAFAAALVSERQAVRFGDLAARVTSRLLRLVRRPPVTWAGRAFAAFRNDTVGLIKRRWHVLTLSTLAGHLSVFAVLLVSLWASGVSRAEVSLIEAFSAWSLARVIGSLPITPGGIGLVELGLTSLLVGFGAPNPEAVAAVLLYRFLTIVPTLVLGVLAGVTWRRHDPRAPLRAPEKPG